MAQLLRLSGVEVSSDPSAIFEWLGRETPAYAKLSYEALGPLGAVAMPVQEEVLR